MPQAPAGYLSVIRTAGAPAAWLRQDVPLTGLADIFPDDPEPEFVDINQANQAVVTLQENNHIVVVDLPSLSVVRHFPAGTVNLAQIDATRAGSGVPNTISLTDALSNVRREPDAAAWVGSRIATANEGDLAGGSRGAQIRAPRAVAGAGSRGERLAVLVGAREPAEVGPVARTGARDEETHLILLRGHAQAEDGRRHGDYQCACNQLGHQKLSWGKRRRS